MAKITDSCERLSDKARWRSVVTNSFCSAISCSFGCETLARETNKINRVFITLWHDTCSFAQCSHWCPTTIHPCASTSHFWKLWLSILTAILRATHRAPVQPLLGHCSTHSSHSPFAYPVLFFPIHEHFHDTVYNWGRKFFQSVKEEHVTVLSYSEKQRSCVQIKSLV